MKKLFLFAFLLAACVVLVKDLIIPAWFQMPPPDARVIAVTITEGVTGREAAAVLTRAGVIESEFYYLAYAKFFGETDVKAGEYGIREHSSYAAISRLLARGPEREETSVTIPEGWTIADITDRLQDSGADLRPSDFYAERFAEAFPFLRGLPDDATVEGFLFPDTYRVWADELPDGLLRKQLSEFAVRTAELRADAAQDGRDFYEVLTLASIIEKEAKHDEDRAKIASVFLNRLKIGMRLQSDATLNYVTRSGKARLSSADLENDSPYNTYKYVGLPPSPIGNPGPASIQAAVHPAETNYFYFLTDAEGNAYFAKTLEEHAANRYRVFGE